MSEYNDSEYNDDNIFDNNIFDNSISPLENEIENLYNMRAKIDKDIKSLWEIVIVPYLLNYNSRQILCNLTENDYSIFYNFMIKNNDIYQYISNRINRLTELAK